MSLVFKTDNHFTLQLSEDELKVIALMLNQIRLGDNHPCSVAACDILDSLEALNSGFLSPSFVEDLIDNTTFDIVLENGDIEMMRLIGDEVIFEIKDIEWR